jgi:hypothetical protein
MERFFPCGHAVHDIHQGLWILVEVNRDTYASLVSRAKVGVGDYSRFSNVQRPVFLRTGDNNLPSKASMLLILCQIFTKFALQFSDFYIVIAASFVSLLLFYWLYTFDDLRCREGGPRDGGNPYKIRRNLLRFYGPKLALVGALWGLLIWLYIYWNRQRDEDPTYAADQDPHLLQGYSCIHR